MGRKIISVFLIAWILLVMPMAAFAEELDMDRVGSISVTLVDPDGEKPLAGAELSLYYVATVKLNEANRPSYTFTDAFVGCGAALDDPALTTVLDVFVQENATPVAKQVTDGQGTANFTNLPLGLYFVKQTGTVENYAACTSFLVTVPNYNDEGYVYDVNATPKTDIAKLTSITIQKVWNTDESTSATDSVTVQLLKDGVVIATAVLNDENEWRIVYTNMPESDSYSIVEVDIPQGFVAAYTQNGYIFTVTNSAFLIQTGQLIWPIPVLALAGLCLIAVGCIVLRKTRNENA
jgi:hypothetical protein